MSDPVARLDAALEGGYAVERALVESGWRSRGVTTGRGRFWVLLLLIACATLGHVDLAAQTINGMLLERGTDRPIDMGLVTLLDMDGDSVAAVLSDEAGRFRVGPPRPVSFALRLAHWDIDPPSPPACSRSMSGLRCRWSSESSP